MERFRSRRDVRKLGAEDAVYTSFDPDVMPVFAVAPVGVMFGAFAGLVVNTFGGGRWGGVAAGLIVAAIHIVGVRRRVTTRVIIRHRERSVDVVNLLWCYRLDWAEIEACYPTHLGVVIMRSGGGSLRAGALPRLGLFGGGAHADRLRFVSELRECISRSHH